MSDNKDDGTPWYEVNAALVRQLMRYLSHAEDKVSAIRELTFSFAKNENFVRNHYWFRDFFFTKEGTMRRGLDRIVDPLQLFLSFCMSSLKPEHRTKRVNSIFEAMGTSIAFKNIDFEGMPMLTGGREITFKSVEGASSLWEYFIGIVSGKQLERVEVEGVLNIYGVDILALSVFSFWVEPSKYIPLDRNMMKLLRVTQVYSATKSYSNKREMFLHIHLGDMQNDIISAAGYKSIIDMVAASMWNFDNNLVEDLEHSERELPKIPRKRSLKSPVDSTEPIMDGGFQILGIFVGAENSSYPILKVNTLYSFYTGFKLDDSIPILIPDASFNLYSQSDNLSINFSAIVGKNGSGKSTLIELIHVLLYNLSVSMDLIKTNYYGDPAEYVKGIDFDFYYYTDGLYRINVGRLGTVDKWNFHKEKWSKSKITSKFLNGFFYTISINYSIYFLNSGLHDQFGWLDTLMHKNDNYQAPIVMTPQRREGNIDAKSEDGLVKQRLLFNLLALSGAERAQDLFTFDQVLGKDKHFTHVEITDITQKISVVNQRLRRKPTTLAAHDQLLKIDTFVDYYRNTSEKLDQILQIFLDRFKVDNEISSISIEYRIYILHKLYWIAHKYFYDKAYERVFEELKTAPTTKLKVLTVKKFASLIFANNSHITAKLKQAIYFIKYGDYLKKYYKLNKKIKLRDLNKDLKQLVAEHWEASKNSKGKSSFSEETALKHLLIPPFFEYTFYCEGTVPFGTLSSGEQQLVSSVTNITYHLMNLSSNALSDQVPIIYENANVILDEIELYFHPEYQRLLLYKITNIFSKLPLERLGGINFILSTHSPFILSDIPSSRILKLERGKPVSSDLRNSFASNIHDLLKDEFFMEGGAMGEFATQFIKKMIKDLGVKKASDFAAKKQLRGQIELIGEPLIRNSLMELWSKTFDMPSYEQLLKEGNYI